MFGMQSAGFAGQEHGHIEAAEDVYRISKTDTRKQGPDSFPDQRLSGAGRVTFAVLNHIGDTPNSGHCKCTLMVLPRRTRLAAESLTCLFPHHQIDHAFVERGGTWFHMNDDTVTPRPVSSLITKDAIVLFYQKRTSGTTASQASPSPPTPICWDPGDRGIPALIPIRIPATRASRYKEVRVPT